MVVPFTALFTAMGLEWVKWGQGRFNWGPRVGALLLLVFGQVAFAGTLVGGWLRQGVDWGAGWLDTWTTYLLGTAAGDAVGYLAHWMPAALLSPFWLAAMFGGIGPFKERMTWRLAWAGAFIPAFVATIPGPAGDFFDWAIRTGASLGAGIITAMFHLKG
jgi:hypothetical protein